MRISLVLMLSTTTLGVFASQADEDKATIEEIIIAIENGWGRAKDGLFMNTISTIKVLDTLNQAAKTQD